MYYSSPEELLGILQNNFVRVFVFIYGACIGSFLNVVIYRIPQGRSVVRPRSTCVCGQLIRWYDNIPILSWIILRGRARCCGGRFSVRYPLVELLTGTLLLITWIQYSPFAALAGAVFLTFLICASFIDYDHGIIPDVFSVGGAVFGVLLSIAVPALHGYESGVFVIDATQAFLESIKGVLIGSGLILWIGLLAEQVLKKEAMGFGDVKLLGCIGAFCGWEGAVVAIFGGAIVGLALELFRRSMIFIFPKKNADSSETSSKQNVFEEGPPEEGQIPFGPALSIAAAIYFLGFHTLVDAAFAEFGYILRSLG